MAIETFRADTEIEINSWSAAGSGSPADVPDAVDEAGAHDGDTTHAVSTSVERCRLDYTLPGNIGASDTIQQVESFITTRKVGSNTRAQHLIRCGTSGTTVFKEGNHLLDSTSYAEFSFVWDDNPRTEVEWTNAQIRDKDGADPDNLHEIGFEHFATSAECRITKHFVEVSYTPAGGGTTWFPSLGKLLAFVRRALRADPLVRAWSLGPRRAWFPMLTHVRARPPRRRLPVVQALRVGFLQGTVAPPLSPPVMDPGGRPRTVVPLDG